MDGAKIWVLWVLKLANPCSDKYVANFPSYIEGRKSHHVGWKAQHRCCEAGGGISNLFNTKKAKMVHTCLYLHSLYDRNKFQLRSRLRFECKLVSNYQIRTICQKNQIYIWRLRKPLCFKRHQKCWQTLYQVNIQAFILGIMYCVSDMNIRETPALPNWWIFGETPSGFHGPPAPFSRKYIAIFSSEIHD